jgi:antirestriction protein ArdC
MRNNIHQEVTELIIAELMRGVRPWVKPWSKTPGLNIPCNAITGRPYSGVNTILLWMLHGKYEQPRYLTFRQALAAGGHVRKGEHGPHIIFSKTVEHREDDDDESDDAGTNYRSGFVLKTFVVFYIAQCDGLPDHVTAPVKPPNSDTRDALIDAFIATTGARIYELGDRAFYQPDNDTITIPPFATFNSRADYLSTLFHELVHWVGHPSRLNRDSLLSPRFGAQAYAAEELIAELGCAMICAEFGVDNVVQHAASIKDYLALLEADSRAFITAASKAHQSVEFLRGLALREEAAA